MSILLMLGCVILNVDSGSIESIPFVSQVKSLVQAISGDGEGARRTQMKFVNRCIIVSQVKAFVHVCQGNHEEALRTSQACGSDLLCFVKGVGYGTPVVGHAIGGILKACGEDKEADAAFKSASRTVGIIGGGVGGFCVGGPAGAVVGGMAGGAAMDGIITGCDKAINGEETPSHGCIRAWEAAVAGDAGSGFDAVFGHAMDGFAGHGYGKTANKIRRNFQEQRIYRVCDVNVAEDNIRGKTIGVSAGSRPNAGSAGPDAAPGNGPNAAMADGPSAALSDAGPSRRQSFVSSDEFSAVPSRRSSDNFLCGIDPDLAEVPRIREIRPSQNVPKPKPEPIAVGEVWVTNSNKHSRPYLNQKESGTHGANQINVCRSGWDKICAEAVDQRCCGKKHKEQASAGPRPYRYHIEKLEGHPENMNSNYHDAKGAIVRPDGTVYLKNRDNIVHFADAGVKRYNMGIPTERLDEVRGIIQKVKAHDPNHWKHNNGVTKFISRYHPGAQALAASGAAVANPPESDDGCDDIDDSDLAADGFTTKHS